MSTIDDQRQAAIERLDAKRGFRHHLGIYILVGAMLIIIWAANGANFFWPIWPIAGWGIGIAAHAYSVYGRPITEDQIQTEIQRQERSDRSTR